MGLKLCVVEAGGVQFYVAAERLAQCVSLVERSGGLAQLAELLDGQPMEIEVRDATELECARLEVHHDHGPKELLAHWVERQRKPVCFACSELA